MNFDRQSLRAIRVEMEEALKAVAKRNGIQLTVGNITYDASSFRCRLEAREIPGNSLNETPLQSPDGAIPANGTLIMLKGRTFEVIDYKADRPKYPIVIVELHGDVVGTKRYKISLDQFATSEKVKLILRSRS